MYAYNLGWQNIMDPVSLGCVNVQELAEFKFYSRRYSTQTFEWPAMC